MSIVTATETDQLLTFYRQMQLIRLCEEQLARSHQRGLVHGACHTYVGQEAIAVGVCAHLRSDDAIFSIDLNVIITSWNQGAERIFGYTPDETIGKPITILVPADRADEEPARRSERVRRRARGSSWGVWRRWGRQASAITKSGTADLRRFFDSVALAPN